MARTQKERDAEKRALKLAEIDALVASGTLSIRRMTDEERERFRPRPRPDKPTRGRRRSAG
jgi:hypothetical protein